MHSGALVLGDACLAAAAAHGFSGCECSCFFLPTAVMLQQGWSATITPYPFRVIFCSVFVVCCRHECVWREGKQSKFPLGKGQLKYFALVQKAGFLTVFCAGKCFKESA